MILKLSQEVLQAETEEKTQLVYIEYYELAQKLVIPKDKHIKFNQFDLVTWLYSKVQEKRFLTLVKEKAKIKL